jgi:hypothetical protein
MAHRPQGCRPFSAFHGPPTQMEVSPAPLPANFCYYSETGTNKSIVFFFRMNYLTSDNYVPSVKLIAPVQPPNLPIQTPYLLRAGGVKV